MKDNRKYFYALCQEFIERIVNKYPCNFTPNISSYVIIQLFLPFVYECSMNIGIEHREIMKYVSILDSLREQYRTHVFLGKDLKKCGFANLTKFPIKAKYLLDSCLDDVEYCMMTPSYFIVDYEKVHYVCNDTSLIKMSTSTPVKPGTYLYCIIPDETLCLFGDHHSAGACGQPVICAGNITIENNKIKQIDNSSGHYSPSLLMLDRAILLLRHQGLIVTPGKLDTEYISPDINRYIFETYTHGGRIKKSIKRRKRRKYTRRLRNKRI
jgi:hypothetical protein